MSDLFEKIAHLVTHRKVERRGRIKFLHISKLESSIYLLSYVVTINTFFYRILRRLLGDKDAIKIVNIYIAPVIEEAAKSVSIKGHFGKTYYVVFNSYEAFSYLRKNARNGVSFIKSIKARLATILMHLLTTLIHKVFSLKIVQDVVNIENKYQAKDIATYISYMISTFIHSIWNNCASVNC